MLGVHCVDQTLQAAPKGLETILMEYLNAQMGDPHDEYEEDLVTALADQGLVNMTEHFLPRRRYWVAGRWKWSMQREGRQVKGRGDYIFSTYRCRFTNAVLQGKRHGTDYRLILAVSRG